MTTIAALETSPVTVGRGNSIGYGTWRLAVELAAPKTAGANVWGAGVWGTFVWSDDWEWIDLTGRFSGCSTQRGTDSPADRIDVGTATMTLNNDDGMLSTWADMTYPWFAEGALVRIVFHDNDGVTTPRPVFTGLVESIVESFDAEGGTTRLVTVNLADTIADVGAVTDPPTFPAGAGESIGQRMTRLFDAAGWRHATTNFGSAFLGILLQATTMTANRLQEAYLAADSADVALFSGPNGAAVLDSTPYNPAPLTRVTVAGATPAVRPMVCFGERRSSITDVATGLTTYFAVLPADSIEVTRDDDAQVAAVSITRVGGLPQSIEGGARNGRRSINRTDIVSTTDDEALTLAQNLYDRLSTAAQRVTVTVNHLADWLDADPRMPLAMMNINISDVFYVWREFARTPAAAGRLLKVWALGIEHNITVVHTSAIEWSATFNGCVVGHYAEGSTDVTTVRYPFSPTP